MASKADKNGLILYSVSIGCLVRLHDDKLFASVALNDMITEGIRIGLQAVDTWPSNINHKEIDAMRKTLNEWGTFLEEYKTQDWRSILYISLAMHSLTDLDEVTSDVRKINKINPLMNIIETLHNSIDPEGRYYVAMEHADTLLNNLYGRIGFVR